jgi:hypothetical protein
LIVVKACTAAVVVEDLAVVAALVAVVVVLDFLVVTVVVVAEEAFEVAVVAVVVEVGELTADEAAADETTAAWLQPAGGLSPQHPIASGDMPKLVLHWVLHPFSSISRIS